MSLPDYPITASFRWTAQELVTAQDVHLRHSWAGRSQRLGRWLLAPLTILLGVASLLKSGFNPGACVFFAVSAWLLLIPVYARRLTLKRYARRPDRDTEVTWEFYPDRIICKGEAASSQVEWRMLFRILEAPQGFLLYPTERIFQWLPTHAFRTAADKDAFVSLAKSNVQRFERKRR